MKMKTICCMLSAVLLFAACNKDDQEVTEAVVKSRPRVTMMTTVNGLGDNGYNDLMVNGLFLFHELMDVPVSLIQPQNMLEAKMAYGRWLALNENADSAVLILGSSAYEEMVKSTPVHLKGKGSRILLLESEAAIDSVTTLTINRYGASYIAGALTAKRNAYVLVAMRNMKQLEEAIQGFKDGHQAYSEGKTKVDVEYLADGEDGFAMPDSAYHVMANHISQYNKNTTIFLYDEAVFPLLGSSFTGAMMAMTTYEFNSGIVVGIDTDRRGQSPCIPFSMVVNVHTIIADYLIRWKTGYEWPATQKLGLSNQATGIIFDFEYVPSPLAMVAPDSTFMDMNQVNLRYYDLLKEATAIEEKRK